MEPANQNTSALSTRKNKPKVTIVMGKVNRTKNGLTRVLSKPSTKAAISAEPKEATLIPGNRYATISSATAFKTQTRSNSITMLLVATSFAVVALQHTAAVWPPQFF